MALKTWSALFFNEQDLIVKLRVSTLPLDRRKLTTLMSFVLMAIPCFKQWVAFTTFVLVQSCIHLSLKKISNVAMRKKNSMKLDKAMYRRKVSLSLICWRVSGGDFRRTPLMLNYNPRKLPMQTITYRTATRRRNKQRKPTWLRSMRHWSTRKFESKLC